MDDNLNDINFNKREGVEYIEIIRNAIRYAADHDLCNVYNWKETFQSKEICAFGLGKFFDDTHERLFQMCNVRYLSDNNPDKLALFRQDDKLSKMGIKIIAPEELKQMKNVFVIAIVGNYIPIQNQMKSYGVENIHISELHFKEYYKGKDLKWIDNALPEIERCLSVLEDDHSKQVFTAVFCNKLLREFPVQYSEIYTDGEYFCTDVWRLGENEKFVDVGAYNGDTVRDFLYKTNRNFHSVFSFELEKGNFAVLSENINTVDSSLRQKIFLYNKGVWRANEKMFCRYDGDSDGCSIVNDGNGSECELVALDSILGNEPITTIKMDIEGAEIDALNGAKKIISEQTPKLAICVYHRPEDLWEIPLKIKELNPDYKVFLRHHCKQNYTDTVCYACTKDGLKS